MGCTSSSPLDPASVAGGGGVDSLDAPPPLVAGAPASATATSTRTTRSNAGPSPSERSERLEERHTKDKEQKHTLAHKASSTGASQLHYKHTPGPAGRTIQDGGAPSYPLLPAAALPNKLFEGAQRTHAQWSVDEALGEKTSGNTSVKGDRGSLNNNGGGDGGILSAYTSQSGVNPPIMSPLRMQHVLVSQASDVALSSRMPFFSHNGATEYGANTARTSGSFSSNALSVALQSQQQQQQHQQQQQSQQQSHHVPLMLSQSQPSGHPTPSSARPREVHAMALQLALDAKPHRRSNSATRLPSVCPSPTNAQQGHEMSTISVAVAPAGTGTGQLFGTESVAVSKCDETVSPSSSVSGRARTRSSLPLSRTPVGGPLMRNRPLATNNGESYSRSSSPRPRGVAGRATYVPLRVSASMAAATANNTTAGSAVTAAGPEAQISLPLSSSLGARGQSEPPLQSVASSPSQLFPSFSLAMASGSSEHQPQQPNPMSATYPGAASSSNSAAVIHSNSSSAGSKQRALPSLSIVTSNSGETATVHSPVFQSGELTPSTLAVQAYAATYGSRSSIAAFKRAYLARENAKVQARAALATLHRDTASSDAAATVPSASATCSVGSQVADSSSTFPVATFQLIASEPPNETATTGVVSQDAPSAAAASSALNNSCPAVIVADTTAAAPLSVSFREPVSSRRQANPATDFLDPGSARKLGHSRSKSAASYAAHLQALAAQQAEAAAAAAANSTAAPTSVPSDATNAGVEIAVHPEEPLSGRAAQIQQLRSSLSKQQAAALSGAAQWSRTPAGRTPAGSSTPLVMSGSELDPPPSAPFAVLDPDIDERMTPLNILDESNQVFHEMYKQWFRDEIAAERREAKRRAMAAATEGVMYSPSRSLFSDAPARQHLHLNIAAVHASAGMSDDECRTPGSAQQRCYTPGGGHTLLAMLTASNSRAGSGANTPAATAVGHSFWHNNSSSPATPVRGGTSLARPAALYSPEAGKSQRVPIMLPNAQHAQAQAAAAMAQ